MIGALCVVIVILLIRPWSDGDRQVPASEVDTRVQGSGTDATPIASGTDGEAATTASPLDPLAVTCGTPSGWRAATLQAWRGRAEPIRSWIAIQPVSASGPLDPRIPFVPVATGVVTAVGYCAPSDDSRPPMVARTSLWAVSRAVARPLSALPLEPATPNALGGLWLAPPELDTPGPRQTAPSPPDGSDDGASPGGSAGVMDGTPRLWPPGRYALQVAAPGGAYEVWLGVEIEDLSVLASPSPDAGAVASPAPSP